MVNLTTDINILNYFFVNYILYVENTSIGIEPAISDVVAKLKTAAPNRSPSMKCGGVIFFWDFELFEIFLGVGVFEHQN